MIAKVDRGQIFTERLFLRRFRDDDIDAYNAISRIIALSKPDNVKSRRVIEKIGLKFIDCREYFKMECAYYESV